MRGDFLNISESRGFTIAELLVALMISGMLLSGALASFSQLSRVSSDYKQKAAAQLQAQSVIDMITPELRMIGNGVPFHQPNFLIAQANLYDPTVTEPILVSGTTASQIKFRINETGETYILTSDFTPSSTASNIVSLTSVSKIFVGDPIYITNSTVGADDGFYGVVSSINPGANTVTFASNSQFSPSSVFAKGSLLEVVPTITYASTANYGGITRDDGTGALTLVPNGQFTVDFINGSGAVISLPLAASSATPFPASAIQNIRSIKLAVQVRSTSPLSSGQYYTASAVQEVGVRNLNYKY